MGLHILGTDHVAIICSEYQKSKDFYTRILGFEINSETYRKERDSWKLDLRVPGGMPFLEIFSFPNTPERLTQPEARGMRHVSFSVANVTAAHEYFVSQGVECEGVRMDTVFERKLFFIRDPDGQPIEIAEPPKNI